MHRFISRARRGGRFALVLSVCVLALSLTVNPASLSAQTTPFTLEYPTDARPAAITRKFVKPAPGKTPHEGVDLFAPSGSPVLAGASGVVKKVVPAEDGKRWGAYVTVKTVHNGIAYKVSYGSLTDIQVTLGQQVAQGTRLAKSANDTIKLVIQASQGGLSGFNVKNVISPKPILQLTGLRLRPIDNGLRVRAEPNTDAAILAQIHQWDRLPTPELLYNAMLRAGKDGKWLRVTTSGDVTGYAAAQYLKVVSQNDPVEAIPGIPIKGVNLDRYHPLGTPPAEPLANLGWVRINYNVSYNPDNGTYGNTDLGAAFNRYYPFIKRYADNGNKVILVFTHQLYGEGQGYVWEQMSSGQWQTLAAQYAQLAGQVATQFNMAAAAQVKANGRQGGKRLVYAYQVWNEQDTLPGNGGAAVPMPVTEYANLLTLTINQIRAADPQATIITGGHVSGDVLGTGYARATLNLMPPQTRPDGIAFHPYGLGPAGSPYSIFGTLDTALKAWSGVLPNTPLWITEWGVLNYQNQDDLTPSITTHASGFMGIIEAEFPGMVAAAAWYAWADGMDNGFGLVNESGQPKDPLYSWYLGMAAHFSPLAEYQPDFNRIPLPESSK